MSCLSDCKHYEIALQIVIGNWQDPSFLHGEKYDTILADYLIGAIDGFSPYFQVRDTLKC
jgi:hypothetical protein